MEASQFIDLALARGSAEGIARLSAAEQIPFLISEAELYCDKDGIDALLHRYGAESLPAFSRAFMAAGATKIARALLALAREPSSEALLSATNVLITSREGYSWESICTAVEPHI